MKIGQNIREKCGLISTYLFNIKESLLFLLVKEYIIDITK